MEGSPSWLVHSLAPWPGPLPERTDQFNIAGHYDVMAELDRDVHDDVELSRTEVEVALRLVGSTPRSVFLPCFGTGRHIRALLDAGVERIVGVDLSPACVAKAQEQFAGEDRVELHVADLRVWRTDERFDAVILLGNSFGDIIDPALMLQVTRGMVAPLAPHGVFVFDYIGKGFLNRCRRRQTTRWSATFHGRSVHDERTPRYNAWSSVMTIDVIATDQQSGEVVWTGAYQKRILGDWALRRHFAQAGVRLHRQGIATALNTNYYRGHAGELGMIAASTWWVGRKA